MMDLNKAEDISLGTTIMAIAYNGGVVFGADTRTSSGNYVANRCSPKITQINPHIFMCRSGSAADTQFIAALLQQYVSMQQYQRENFCPVQVAAKVAAKISYSNKDYLSAGLIVGGWDPYLGGQVYEIPSGGSIMKVEYALGGSGSTYIQALIQNIFKKGLDRQGALTVVKKCIAHAVGRDGSSGGCIRAVVVEKDYINIHLTRGEDVEVTYGDLAYPKLKYQQQDQMETDQSTQQQRYTPIKWVKQ